MSFGTGTVSAKWLAFWFKLYDKNTLVSEDKMVKVWRELPKPADVGTRSICQLTKHYHLQFHAIQRVAFSI